MATPALELPRFVLPPRMRRRNDVTGVTAACFDLIGRIAELPHVETMEVSDSDTVMACVSVQMDRSRPRKRAAPTLLCRVSYLGIVVECLNNAERHHILSRGWGRLQGNHILLHLPRDESELEVCWSVLYRAYNKIINASETKIIAPRVFFDNLPKPSRTPLS